ncbi:DNA mismatch repair protein [Malassezia nana]|uniref:DNA mismatch repair protein n=1 Tax=Malassezia nana TaxID=180528 RepID=A0AAF0J377_9BASI|nr:DNA mismatch repair protein [Malassezia nana]
MRPGPVRRLSTDTASAVRAHARLASLERIVWELSEHALATGATRLDIHVDMKQWRLACIHNGHDDVWVHAQGCPLELHKQTLEQVPVYACLAWLGLLEDNHVLYAGLSTKRQRETRIVVHDIWWRMPVRRHMARRRERRLRDQIRQLLVRLALAYPQVRLRAPGLRLGPTIHLSERVRAVMPTFELVRTVQGECTFSSDQGVWHATIQGVVGQAAGSLRCLWVNGQLVPRADETLVRSTCPVHVPWSAALAQAWDNSTSLYQHIARCLGPPASVHVLQVRVQRTAAPGIPLADWQALLSYLLSTQPSAPSALPLPACMPSTTSPYFPAAVSAPVPRLVRTEGLVPSLPRLLPHALASVRAIAQVDQKYLFCVCGGDASEPLSLLCLDQHAVDERVRLEELTRTYMLACLEGKGHAMTLSTPVPMPMVPPPHVRASLSFWGWKLCVTESHVPSCDISAIPIVLSFLLSRPSSEVVACAMACAAWMADTGHSPEEADKAERLYDTPLAALLSMPPPVREALATKACHTAIRFHQPLVREQIERLLVQWSDVSLPFQCAHGRPSAVCLWRTPHATQRSRPVRWDRLASTERGGPSACT